MPAAKSPGTVRVAAGRVVYVDGEPFRAGQVVTVTAAEAAQLVKDGDGEKA